MKPLILLLDIVTITLGILVAIGAYLLYLMDRLILLLLSWKEKYDT